MGSPYSSRRFVSSAIVFAAVSVGLLLYTLTCLSQWGPERRDVDAWIHAGRVLSDGGVGLYELNAIARPFLSSPAWAALWAPFSGMDVAVPYILWAVLLWATLLLGALVLSDLTGIGWWLSAFVPLALNVVWNGQVDGVLVAGVVVAALLLERDADSRAGATIGILAHVKTYPVVILPVLYLTGRRRAAWWGALTFAALALLPAAWTGIAALPALYVDHLDALASLEPSGYSLGIWLPRWAIAALAVGGIALVVRVGPGPLPTLALPLVAVMIASPVFWRHSFIVTALLVASLYRVRPAWAIGWCGVALVLGTVPYDLTGPHPLWMSAPVALWVTTFGALHAIADPSPTEDGASPRGDGEGSEGRRRVGSDPGRRSRVTRGPVPDHRGGHRDPRGARPTSGVDRPRNRGSGGEERDEGRGGGKGHAGSPPGFSTGSPGSVGRSSRGR